MATVPRGTTLQHGKEEEEIESGKQVTGRASMHRDNRKREPENLLEEMKLAFYRQNTWHNEL